MIGSTVSTSLSRSAWSLLSRILRLTYLCSYSLDLLHPGRSRIFSRNSPPPSWFRGKSAAQRRRDVWVPEIKMSGLVALLLNHASSPEASLRKYSLTSLLSRTVVKTLNKNDVQTLLLTAPPYVLAVITTFANSYHADKTGERFFQSERPPFVPWSNCWFLDKHYHTTLFRCICLHISSCNNEDCTSVSSNDVDGPWGLHRWVSSLYLHMSWCRLGASRSETHDHLSYEAPFQFFTVTLLDSYWHRNLFRIRCCLSLDQQFTSETTVSISGGENPQISKRLENNSHQ